MNIYIFEIITKPRLVMPEMAVFARQISDPQDLNEALLSVAYDSAAAALNEKVQLHFAEAVLKALQPQ